MSQAVAICSDYGYLTPAETLIKSIAYHNHQLAIYLLNTNVPQEWFLNINRRLAPVNVRVVDAKFSAAVLKDEAVSRTEYMNTMIYGRLLIPQLVPADRVLYIDSDSVVDGSLQPLFDTDLEGKIVGAVEDYSMPGTFNSGVLLQALPDCEFNVAAWTEMGEALLTLAKYPNLHLYPAVVESNIDMLINQADGYLDINEGGKEVQFMERCVQRNKPLLSYNEYPDNPVLTAALQKFDREQPDQLIAAIKRL